MTIHNIIGDPIAKTEYVHNDTPICNLLAKLSKHTSAYYLIDRELTICELATTYSSGTYDLLLELGFSKWISYSPPSLGVSHILFLSAGESCIKIELIDPSYLNWYLDAKRISFNISERLTLKNREDKKAFKRGFLAELFKIYELGKLSSSN